MKSGKILALALKAAPPPGKKKAPEGDDAEKDEEDAGGIDSAISDFVDAVKAGDKKAARVAFKAAHEMCSDYEE